MRKKASLAVTSWGQIATFTNPSISISLWKRHASQGCTGWFSTKRRPAGREDKLFMANRILSVLLIDDSQDDAFLILRDLRHAGFALTSERVHQPHSMHIPLNRQLW